MWYIGIPLLILFILLVWVDSVIVNRILIAVAIIAVIILLLAIALGIWALVDVITNGLNPNQEKNEEGNKMSKWFRKKK